MISDLWSEPPPAAPEPEGKPIAIGFSKKFDELWFVGAMATESGVFSDPETAFHELAMK